MSKNRNPGGGQEQPNEQDVLRDRVTALFSDCFDRLDRLQNAREVTQDDRDFIEATERDVVDCGRKARGGIDEASRKFLEQIDSVLKSARSNAFGKGRATFVESRADGKEKVKKTKGDKKKEERARRAVERAAEETGGDPDGSGKWSEEDVNQAWRDYVKEVDSLILKARHADSASFEYAYRDALERYDGLLNALEGEEDAARKRGEEISSHPILVEVGEALDRFGADLEELREKHLEREVEPVKDEGEEGRRELGERFQEAITGLNKKIDALEALPMETEEEVAYARKMTDEVSLAMNDYLEDWKNGARPILDGFGDKDWPRSWATLASSHKKLRIRYFGLRGDGARPGVEAVMRSKVREKEGEFGTHRFEREFPNFELSVAAANKNSIDAMLEFGDARQHTLEMVKNQLEALSSVWGDLRRTAPRQSEEDRVAGKRSIVNIFDRKLTAMIAEVGDALKVASKSSRPMDVYSLARRHRNSVIRVDQLWNPGTNMEERGVFFTEFAEGRITEESPEFLAMIPEGQRVNFKLLAKSDVIKLIHRRGVRDRREQEAEERRERAQLRHPKLAMLRVQINGIYDGIMQANFWRDSIDEKDRRLMIRTGAEMADEDLQNFVTDVTEFRRGLDRLTELRRQSREVEDVLLAGGEISGETGVDGIRDALNLYGSRKRRENNAWISLIRAEGWNLSFSKRKQKLHAFFDVFRRQGRRAFALQRVPEALQEPLREWVELRLNLFVAGRHAQWVLDENPEIAREIKGLPPEFSVRPSADSGADDSADAGHSAPLSDADRVGLDSAAADATGDTVGGDDSSDAMDTGSFSGDSAASTLLDRGTDDGDLADLDDEADVDDSGDLDADDVGVSPVVVLSSGSVLEPKIEPIAPEPIVDARREAIIRNEKAIRDLLTDDMFWNADVAKIGRVNRVRGLLKRTEANARLLTDEGLRADRIEDFYSATAFTSFEDLEARIAVLREKYRVEAPVAPVPVSPIAGSDPVVPAGRSSTSPPVVPSPSPAVPTPTSSSPRMRSPRSTRGTSGTGAPVVVPVETAPPLPSSSETPPPEAIPVPLPEAPRLAALSDDPFDAFFRSPSSQSEASEPSPRVSSRPHASEAPLPVETPVSPRERGPVAAPVGIPVRESSQQRALGSSEPVHPEERVSSWARSIRSTVGRWFGRDIGDYAASEVTGARMNREREGREVSSHELGVRVAATTLGFFGKLFGYKVVADVPRYVTQSFCSAKEKAYLQEELLSAMEKESKGRASIHDEARVQANIEASNRLERALATSTYLTKEQRETMKTRVNELREKYQDRTRKSMEARTIELAAILEETVTTKVTGFGTVKETANSALRVMALVGAPLGAVRGVMYGVMSFRERFEGVVKREGNMGVVANVAATFRDVWQDVWGKLTTKTETNAERAMNVVEALSIVGTMAGMTGIALGGLEESLPGLRLLEGGERSGVAQLVTEARASVQNELDKILPGIERTLRRAV